MSGFLGDLSKEQEEAVKSLKLKLDELKLTEKMSKTDFEREVLRFLRARKFKVDKTLEMIKKYLVIHQEKFVYLIIRNGEKQTNFIQKPQRTARTLHGQKHSCIWEKIKKTIIHS
jgi:hypothetical protein